MHPALRRSGCLYDARARRVVVVPEIAQPRRLRDVADRVDAISPAGARLGEPGANTAAPGAVRGRQPLLHPRRRTGGNR